MGIINRSPSNNALMDTDVQSIISFPYNVTSAKKLSPNLGTLIYNILLENRKKTRRQTEKYENIYPAATEAYNMF